MKAVVIREFGSVDALRIEDLPTPEPAPDEVLVKVHAASINPVDYKIRSGNYPRVTVEQLPMVLGRDVAGTVERCGSGAAKFKPDDAVYALLDSRNGGYAEFVLVKERDLVAKPAQAGFNEAAAVPLAAITAWQGLFDHGHLQSGQHVLIHGGAGGVGHFAIQCAKALGARVLTTVSKLDLEFARELGADQVIDAAGRFEDELSQVDLVFDLVGGPTQDRSWAVLKHGGTLVSTVSQPSEARAKAHSVHADHYFAQPSARELGEIGELLDAGRVRPHIAAVFRLEAVAAAQRQLESHHNRGKIVLHVFE
jgi:NADPH:quinone reductase-like Zn-dependent oxidoreductase